MQVVGRTTCGARRAAVSDHGVEIGQAAARRPDTGLPGGPATDPSGTIRGEPPRLRGGSPHESPHLDRIRALAPRAAPGSRLVAAVRYPRAAPSREIRILVTGRLCRSRRNPHLVKVQGFRKSAGDLGPAGPRRRASPAVRGPDRKPLDCPVARNPAGRGVRRIPAGDPLGDPVRHLRGLPVRHLRGLPARHPKHHRAARPPKADRERRLRSAFRSRPRAWADRPRAPGDRRPL